jgi:glyoxylase-like metal-dependent hydrolase (beta-lactamase superfamily II)
MSRRTGVATTAFLILLSFSATLIHAGGPRYAQAAEIDAIANALGAGSLKSIAYSGSGYNFAVGQSVRPGESWPRFIVKSYKRVIDYDSVSSREELLRTQGENPPRGGGGQPLMGEQRQILVVSGSHAWNVSGDTAAPAPAALGERLLQIWLTPHGFIKAAKANKATLTSRTVGGRKQRVISFEAHGKFKMRGVVNEQNLVESVETWTPNPVLGDMTVEAIYSDYKDWGGIKFPSKIVQKQGGFPSLELTVTEAQPNASVEFSVPQNVSQAAPSSIRVQADKLADGVWYVTGGSHHSVAVEFKDHVVVVEGPQIEDRSLAVIAEVKKLVPGKPIKFLVNTHHHFDHSGGIRTYASEGASIITHQVNVAFYTRAFRTPRTLAPDSLSRSGRRARFQGVAGKKVLTDGTRVMELHHIAGNAHNAGILMAYLPAEKILIEADVFTPGAPGAPPPATPNPFSVNLHENIQRLGLAVEQIAPLHGRLVPMSDLLKAIGKGS